MFRFYMQQQKPVSASAAVTHRQLTQMTDNAFNNVSCSHMTDSPHHILYILLRLH